MALAKMEEVIGTSSYIKADLKVRRDSAMNQKHQEPHVGLTYLKEEDVGLWKIKK